MGIEWRDLWRRISELLQVFQFSNFPMFLLLLLLFSSLQSRWLDYQTAVHQAAHNSVHDFCKCHRMNVQFSVYFRVFCCCCFFAPLSVFAYCACCRCSGTRFKLLIGKTWSRIFFKFLLYQVQCELILELCGQQMDIWAVPMNAKNEVTKFVRISWNSWKSLMSFNLTPVTPPRCQK